MSEQSELSFSSAAKDAAAGRFPEGTLDWFLPSDFSIECPSVALLDQIAKGSFGTVYKGVYDGKLVAVKIEEFHEDDQEQVNLLVELSMLQSFPHDRMVKYFGAGCLPESSTGKKTVMIVMELCEHGALRENLKRELPWNLKARLAWDIASGIAFLHENGIVHRDIKTTNVLVDEEWRAKLCDFSFACHESSSTKENFVCGTDEFMSPEVALAQTFGVSADIFSFGILLCELLTNREPNIDFLYRRPQDLFALNEEEFRSAVLSACPEVLEAMALQCCDVNPENRPSARECAEALEKVLEELGGCEFSLSTDDILLSPRRDSFSLICASPDREGHVTCPQRASLGTSPRLSRRRDADARISHLEVQMQELRAENARLNRDLLSIVTHVGAASSGPDRRSSRFLELGTPNNGRLSYFEEQNPLHQPTEENLLLPRQQIDVQKSPVPESATTERKSRRVSRRMSAASIVMSPLIGGPIVGEGDFNSNQVEMSKEIERLKARLESLEHKFAQSTSPPRERYPLGIIEEIDCSDPDCVREAIEQVQQMQQTLKQLETSLRGQLKSPLEEEFSQPVEAASTAAEENNSLEPILFQNVQRNGPTTPSSHQKLFLTAVESVDGDSVSHLSREESVANSIAVPSRSDSFSSNLRYQNLREPKNVAEVYVDDDGAEFDVDLSQKPPIESKQVLQRSSLPNYSSTTGLYQTSLDRTQLLRQRSSLPPEDRSVAPENLSAALGTFLEVVQKCSSANEKTKELVSNLDRGFGGAATKQLFVGDYLSPKAVGGERRESTSQRRQSLTEQLGSASQAPQTSASTSAPSFLHPLPQTTLLNTGKGHAEFLLSSRKSPASFSFSNTPTMRGAPPDAQHTGGTARSSSPESAAKTWKLAGGTPVPSPLPTNIAQYHEYRSNAKRPSDAPLSPKHLQSGERSSHRSRSPTNRTSSSAGKDYLKSIGSFGTPKQLEADSSLAKNFFRADPTYVKLIQGTTRRESPTNKSHPELLFPPRDGSNGRIRSDQNSSPPRTQTLRAALDFKTGGVVNLTPNALNSR